MKAKELQIGDWVDLSDEANVTIPCKVVGIMPEELYEIQPNDKACDIVGYDMVRPIPLTAEIIEKNGFEKYAMYHTLHEKQVRIEYYWHESRLEIQPYDGEPWIRLAPLRYVHELQHALRLCGLNELADNFEI